MIPTLSAAAPLFRSDLVRWQHLVGPAWLAQLLEGQAVVAAPQTLPWRLLEVGCDAAEAFARAHIPGADYLDTNRLEQEPFWNAVPDAVLLHTLGMLGIRHTTTVILYGRNTTAAARAAHLMLYAGVADVRLLDGGLDAWVAAGLPLAGGPVAVRRPPADARDFGVRFPAHPNYLLDTPLLKARLKRQGTTLASIRTWDEYCGKTSGYSYIAARGEIPGAVWGRAGDNGEDMNSMRAYQNEDGSMKPAADILAFWREAGIVAERPTAFYCGTGWRASLAFFYAWLMGWQDIAVYDGGWFEWSSDPGNPRRIQDPCNGGSSGWIPTTHQG